MGLDVLTGTGLLDAGGFAVSPGEEHRVYGAVFLLLGTLAVAEALAGGVWHRAQWRSLIEPASLSLMGVTVITVNAMQVTPNLLHLVLGGLLMAGGALEWEACVRGVRSRVADATIIGILVAGGIVLGPLHHAPSFERVDVIHWLSGATMIPGVLQEVIRHVRWYRIEGRVLKLNEQPLATVAEHRDDPYLR